MYLLITNKSVINKARKEVDNLLIKFCRRRQSNSYQPLLERKKRPLIHNNVSSYVATLSKNTSQTPPQAILYSPPSYKRPVSITFTPDPISTNKTWTISPSPFSFPFQFSHLPLGKEKTTMKHRSSTQLQQPIQLTTNLPHHPGRIN